ncbi:hypothetical protein B0H11DRAFT_2191585 [Mycena galericulata]|nr:hypothetical protein B0H11DRAFT_2191585 [Mycena galericulata]
MMVLRGIKPATSARVRLRPRFSPCFTGIRAMTIDKFSLFRVISFSLAGGDVVQTIPRTFRLYRKQWVNGSLSPVCFFYAMARYMSILSLVSNGVGFFGTGFTPPSCQRFYMLPNVTAMLAGMAVQVLIFIRTFAISGRSKRVYFGLGTSMLLLFPVQMFGIVYHRDPFLSEGSCVFSRRNTRYYLTHLVAAKEEFFTRTSAHMTFDLLACGTATFYLVFSSRIGGSFNTSRFVGRVLRNGLLYTLVVFLVNLWVSLEFAGVFTTGAASTLPLAVVLIAVQHLILSTQRLASDEAIFTDEYRQSTSGSAGMSGPPRFISGSNTQDVELQSGVFVVTETTDDGKPNYSPAKQKSNLDAENTSIASTGMQK